MYLTRAYWSEEIPRPGCRACGSGARFVLGLMTVTGLRLVLARFVSDFATFAYVCDVYVLQEHQGAWALEGHDGFCHLSIRKLQGLRRWMLVTNDAHGLYAQYGFRSLALRSGLWSGLCLTSTRFRRTKSPQSPGGWEVASLSPFGG